MPTPRFSPLDDALNRAFAADDPAPHLKLAERDRLPTIVRCFEAIGLNDFAAIETILTDDVTLEIHAPPAYPWVRRAAGRKVVLDAAHANYASVLEQTPTVQSMVAQGDLFDLLMHETGVFKSTGVRYTCKGLMQFHFRGPLIDRVLIVVADVSP